MKQWDWVLFANFSEALLGNSKCRHVLCCATERPTKPSALVASSRYGLKLPGTAHCGCLFPPRPSPSFHMHTCRISPSAVHGVVYICIRMCLKLAHVLFILWMPIKTECHSLIWSATVAMSSTDFHVCLFFVQFLHRGKLSHTLFIKFTTKVILWYLKLMSRPLSFLIIILIKFRENVDRHMCFVYLLWDSQFIVQCKELFLISDMTSHLGLENDFMAFRLCRCKP